MRALRVLGTTDGGRTVLCDDPASAEQFAVANDGTLKAAVRGERPATVKEQSGEVTLSPREIQRLIRAGATVEDLAARAGTTLHRIDRFAYPVLQERATVAEKARKAHPTVDGLPAEVSLQEMLPTALAQRGLAGPVTWDAYRPQDTWVLVASWPVGHSTTTASWDYHPDADGGTLTARDDTAAELADPALRVLRPVRELKAVGAPDPLPVPPLRSPSPTVTAPAAPAEAGQAAADVVISRGAPASAPAAPAVTPPTRQARSAGKSGRRPAMPSWDDVLLGGRS